MSDKFKLNTPDFGLLQTDYSKVSEIANKNIEPLNYEDTILAEQANDIKESFKTQVKSINSIAQSAKELAKASKTQSKLAVKKSKDADIKGWIAIAISVLAFAWSIISYFI